jgi:hypothetical protein
MSALADGSVSSIAEAVAGAIAPTFLPKATPSIDACRGRQDGAYTGEPGIAR